MPLTNFYNKIVRLQTFDVLKETMEIINANAEEIKVLLINQLQRGKDGKKQNVTVFGRDYYADKTVFEKERHGVGLGKLTEWITNYMTGSFYNSLVVKTSGTVFDIKGEVEYFPDIIKRSGTVIMQLDIDSLEIFKQKFLAPQLKARFSKHFNGL